MRKLKFLIGVFAGFFTLIILIALLSPGPSGDISEADARAIAGTIITQVSGSHSSLVQEAETNLAMTVHVDTSASMAGYVYTNTVFVKVLDYLTPQWNARMHAAGTGYPPGKDYVTDGRFFRKPENYFGGHDMAATIQSFSKEPGRMHLLVTDGQPWDFGNAPAYEKIAGAINDFLTAGGRCVLVLYRSEYRGYYPSPRLVDQPKKTVFYECANRPFAVWIFAHGGSALNRVVTDLAGQGGELRWASKIQFGEPELTITLTNRTLPGGVSGGKLGREIGSLKPVRTGNEVGRARDYQIIRLMQKAADDQGCVPLQFDITPVSGEFTEKGLETLRNGLSVGLDCWEIVNKPAGTGGNDRSMANLNAGPGQPGNTNQAAKLGTAGVQPYRIEKLRHFDIDDKKCALQLSTNAAVTNVSGAVTPGAVKVRLVVPLPRRPSDKTRRVAWVMSLGPKYTGSSLVLPRGFSTPDDTDRSACDKILKLDEMLNIVAGRTERLGNVLMLTDYPK